MQIKTINEVLVEIQRSMLITVETSVINEFFSISSSSLVNNNKNICETCNYVLMKLDSLQKWTNAASCCIYWLSLSKIYSQFLPWLGENFSIFSTIHFVICALSLSLSIDGFSLESAIFFFNNACHAHITFNDPHHPIVNMTPVVLFKCFQKLK
jgi:hypothetical protein